MPEMPKLVLVVGGPLHGEAIDRSMLEDGLVELSDDVKLAANPPAGLSIFFSRRVYSLRRFERPDDGLVMECLAEQGMTDAAVLDLIDRHDMTRRLRVTQQH